MRACVSNVHLFHPRRVKTPKRGALAGPRASTTWSLDGVGCAGARSGDERLVRRPPPEASRCPLRPIDVSSLCDSHHGRFAMQDVVFEQDGGNLFVYAMKTPDTDDLSGATKQWAKNLAPMERMPMVKLFLFLVSVQEFWSTITSQIRAATVGDAPRAAEPVALHRTPSSEPTRSSGGLLVDGREIPAFQRWLLRPGAVLNLGGDEFEVHRSVHAHA